MVRTIVAMARMSLGPVHPSSAPQASSSVTMGTAPTPPTSVMARISVVMAQMKKTATTISVSGTSSSAPQGQMVQLHSAFLRTCDVTRFLTVLVERTRLTAPLQLVLPTIFSVIMMPVCPKCGCVMVTTTVETTVMSPLPAHQMSEAAGRACSNVAMEDASQKPGSVMEMQIVLKPMRMRI